MSNYIPRFLSEEIKKSPEHKAVVFFGARQVGKTTMLSQIFGGQDTRWLNGDNPETVKTLTALASSSDLEIFLAGSENIVIDEAQCIPSVGLLIKRLVDLNSQTRIFVTGSSSLDLAGGILESAAGRIRSFTLWSLSFGEIAHKFSEFEALSSLSTRLVYGSYPSVIVDSDDSRDFLANYYNSVVFKDIFSYSGIRQYPAFLRLVQILAHRIGSLSTYESLARECGLSSKTVESYLALLEECFIIKVLNSYSNNQANELKKSKKIYFCDLGVRNAAIGDFSPFSARTHEEQGNLFENYFIMERIKLHSYKDRCTRHYFWRNKAASEVDLVEIKDREIEAFEIKLTEQKVSAPESFLKSCPNAKFSVVNKENFYRYLLNSEPVNETI